MSDRNVTHALPFGTQGQARTLELAHCGVFIRIGEDAGHHATCPGCQAVLQQIAQLDPGDAVIVQTHYVPSFTQPQPRGAQTAVCGQAVYASEHSSEPTCDKCQRWINDDEKDAAALAAKWDAEASAARAQRTGGA